MQSKQNNILITVKPEVYIILAVSVLLLPIGLVLAWITATAAHELFHYAALKLCRCRIDRIQIGVNGARMDAGPMSYGKEAICALAGPLAGFVLIFAAKWFPKVVICGFIQSCYNLFPIFPMDGGRILRSIMRKWFDIEVADSICKWTENIFVFLICCVCLYLTFVISLGPIPVIWIVVLIIKNKMINSPCKDRPLRVQ